MGGSAVSQVNGAPRTGSAPLPYKRTADTPNLGVLDTSDDIRGGMGIEGLAELAKFVQDGGTLITEGSTATIFPAYGITTGVTVEEPATTERLHIHWKVWVPLPPPLIVRLATNTEPTKTGLALPL